jgi:hypothetical protein
MIADDEIELVTRRAECDGFKLVITQEFVQRLRGGSYSYVIFDQAENLAACHNDTSLVYLPASDECDGRITQVLAEYLLLIHVYGYTAVVEQIEAGQAAWLTGGTQS